MYKTTKDLDEILNVYENELCNRIFKYQLNNKTEIEVVFYKENFCHLLGLQHIYGKDNKSEYNRIKIKIDHFDEIPIMMAKGKFIKFYQYRTQPLSTIIADFVIYHNNKEYILHLFLRQENKKTNQYAPISFIAKSGNDKNRHQFIAMQEHKKLTGMEIIRLNHEDSPHP